MTKNLSLCGLLLGALGLAATTAQARDFDLGVRFNAVAGSGKPTNDILGYGLFGHYRFGDRWSLGFALDYSPEFDVERAAELVGVPQDPTAEVIDALGTSTTLSGWAERTYGQGGRWEWFWLVGAGVNDVDIDPASGPRAGGGSFEITTDAGTEFLALFGGGVRRSLGERFALEVALAGQQHFGTWDLVDRVSGATGTIDDYFVSGIRFGLLRRF